VHDTCAYEFLKKPPTSFIFLKVILKSKTAAYKGIAANGA
jgi:hypothetical protein